MSSETIVTAIFLITAVVAAGILTSQIFPAIYTMSGTVSSSAHAADQSMRTDISIVNYCANTATAQIWVKNVGSSQISLANLNATDIWVNYVRLDLPSGDWSYEIPGNTNSYWDPMETMHINAKLPATANPGDDIKFQIALYDGTKRSAEFTAMSSGC